MYLILQYGPTIWRQVKCKSGLGPHCWRRLSEQSESDNLIGGALLKSLNWSKFVIRIIFVWIFEFIFVWNFNWYLSLVLGDNLIGGPHLNWAVLVTFNELVQIDWPVLLYLSVSFQICIGFFLFDWCLLSSWMNRGIWQVVSAFKVNAVVQAGRL